MANVELPFLKMYVTANQAVFFRKISEQKIMSFLFTKINLKIMAAHN